MTNARSAGRLVLLVGIGLLVLGYGSLSAMGSDDIVRFGLVTDIHAHDLDSPGEGKWMTRTGERLAAFTSAMNDWGADFVIELGDFINGWVVLGVDPGDPARVPDILVWARGLLDSFNGPVYHVIGNHDVYNLDKHQYLDILGMDSTYYSFDLGGFHFVVLDVQYALDGSDLARTYTGVAGFVPEPVLTWLQNDLADTDAPTIVFVHQMLDDFVEVWGRATVLNQLDLQRLFAEDGDVVAVFQGHAHANVHHVLDGIHYVTFEAMVDQGTPATWAQITLDPYTRTIVIEGLGAQASYELTYPGE